MKKLIFYLIIITFSLSAVGQNAKNKSITGSWINAAVFDYYESLKDSTCNVFHLNYHRLEPLYLSFNDRRQLKITYRYEQPGAIYKITQSAENIVVIAFGKKFQKIYLENGLLKLKIEGNLINEGNLITFKKVSDNYSNDVFGEFIKGIIFKKYNTYLIASFTETNIYNNKRVKRNDFRQVMKEIFNCDAVDIAQMGTFKHQHLCLPEIAIYYNDKGSKWTNPRVLGIQSGNDYVRLIDTSGVVILTLKPN